MRVALLNGYLQAGHTEIAETESSARFIEAARRMGIEAQIFARSEDIPAFAPDFVLALSYTDAKLTGYPTYVLLTMPVGWIKNQPRFLRNILSCDGYWTVAPNVSRYVGALYEEAGKPDFGAFVAISCARTEFVPLDFSGAWAAYVGTNWDGHRHGDVFRALAPLEVAKFYGKRERWSHLPDQAFGGEVPFDGVSLLDIYRAAGIGLCLGHRDFDADGIPTSRIFEVPAASAVMIAGRNRLVEGAFGDAALYVDTDGPPDRVAGKIRGHVEWIRAHPQRAREMAKTCHRVFNERFSMEALLANGLAMHESARARLGFERPIAAESAGGVSSALDTTILIAVRDDTLRFLDRCLHSVSSQTLAPSRVVIMDGTSAGVAMSAARARAGAPVVQRRVPRGLTSAAALLARAERDIASEWVSCISVEEVLYPNHLFAVAEAVRRHRARHRGHAPGFVYSGVVQVSDTSQLPEFMNDRDNVKRAGRMRLAQFDFHIAWQPIAGLPLDLASSVLHVPALRGLLRRPWLLRLVPELLEGRLRSIASSGRFAFTAAVTLASSSTRRCAAHGRFTPP